MARWPKEEERFWSRVERTPTCWLWRGALRRGYGNFSAGGEVMAVHRYSWERANGPIPDGLQIDHICRVRNCVRPSHLRVVDQRTNVLAGIAPTAENARKTHCPKGHEYTRRWNGRMGWQRVCTTCRSENARRRYQAAKSCPPGVPSGQDLQIHSESPSSRGPGRGPFKDPTC
jgi:hypothetical protein